ncbi:MAG: hypothetical protein OEN50_08420 [Deltaproteobacteria bacterium]|nr:hypothetical protein [Deltaproteobacteria bacterium]
MILAARVREHGGREAADVFIGFPREDASRNADIDYVEWVSDISKSNAFAGRS